MSLLQTLKPHQIAAAVTDILDAPQWPVIEAIIQKNAEAIETQLLAADSPHHMAVLAGKLHAYRHLTAAIKAYSKLK